MLLALGLTGFQAAFPDVEEIGHWHTHLGDDGTPSPRDLMMWSASRAICGLEQYLGIVITPCGERGGYHSRLGSRSRWARIKCHAFIARRGPTHTFDVVEGSRVEVR